MGADQDIDAVDLVEGEPIEVFSQRAPVTVSGRGPPKPWAARAIRRASGRESFSAFVTRLRSRPSARTAAQSPPPPRRRDQHAAKSADGGQTLAEQERPRERGEHALERENERRLGGRRMRLGEDLDRIGDARPRQCPRTGSSARRDERSRRDRFEQGRAQRREAGADRILHEGEQQRPAGAGEEDRRQRDGVAQAKSARSTSASPMLGGPSAPPEARSHAPTSDTKPAPTISRADALPSPPRRQRGQHDIAGSRKPALVALVVSIPACCRVVPKKSARPITSARRHSSRLGACGLRRNSQSANGASAAAETAKRAATKASAGIVAVAYFCATNVTPHRKAVKKSRPSALRRLMPPSIAEFPCSQTCSISISVPAKSFGCKNSTGLP